MSEDTEAGKELQNRSSKLESDFQRFFKGDYRELMGAYKHEVHIGNLIHVGNLRNNELEEIAGMLGLQWPDDGADEIKLKIRMLQTGMAHG